MCDYVAQKASECSFEVLGIEGDLGSDWILLDLGDVIVHAFTATAREHYSLEKLWSVGGDSALQS
jgi:ribosome-associated protein